VEMGKIHNFSAGPAIIDQGVINQTIEALRNFDDTGLSLVEVSHRDKEFLNVLEEAKSIVKELLGLDDDYSVLFLHGGASMQFCMIPYNLLGDNDFAAYLNTGVWAQKAIKEARVFGNVNIVASSEDKNFNYIPKSYFIPENISYFHCTSNNTIYGTEMFDFPEVNVPLVCDMSSDIFSRAIDANKFSLIYAGAQKNLGPAGTTLLIIKKVILGKVNRKIPSMLDYKLQIENDSLYNTPAVFAIYMCLQTLKWIKKTGIEEIEKRNIAKAKLLYDEIDRNSLFIGTSVVEDRSRMNVNFLGASKDIEAEFLQFSKLRNLNGLKGHRSVGGLRASIYNAMPIESVQALVDVMREFEHIKK